VTNVLNEILQWSQDRPAWQRDALRRLVASEKTTQDELSELVNLAKAAHGLTEPAASQPLTEEHLAVTARNAGAVLLESVTHHRGVNALAAEQTVRFGPNLTVVYGQNAAGKSGYTRILKRACRSRGLEDVLGNVLSGETPLKPQATIAFRQESIAKTLAWAPDAPAAEALASVSVFDAHCAPIYLRDKTDVAFRPFGLDIFDKLSVLCGQVRARLGEEQKQLTAAAPSLLMIPEGTQARVLCDGLTPLTKVDDVRSLASISRDKERRLTELHARLRDYQTTDPKRRAKELALKAGRLASVVRHLEELSAVLGDQSVSDLRSASNEARAAREALAEIREAAFSANVMPGTGEEAWTGMWEAAEAFSNVAYPDAAFPVTANDARCPLCQQTIGAEASERLRHFAEYAISRVQTDVRAADGKYRTAHEKVRHASIERDDIKLAVDELSEEEPECAERVRKFFVEASKVQTQIKTANEHGSDVPLGGVGPSGADELGAFINSLRRRVSDLDGKEHALDAKEAAELKELEARILLRDNLQIVLDEIERKQRLAAYRQCLDDTNTQTITRKSTELTKELVTDRLRDTFKGELDKLEFNHLLVEIQAAGGAKGALFHRILFPNAPGVAVTDVLSEGESRALSLAAFLTELSTSISPSAIIFDDPVSSLDHIWREKIGRRLVMEAKDRQVIVFTHDLLFMRILLDEAGRQKVQCDTQYVRRDAEPGLCSADVPWVAMRVKERIGRLRDMWQTADKLHRTAPGEEYEREARDVYGFLREAWEQAIVEVLLNDVVERYRHGIQAQRVRDLHDITSDDCTALDDAMTECSRWIRGHDQAAADGTPLPGPANLRKSIDDLDDWVRAIRKRRN
jgi:hypothetical protein